MNIEGGIAVDPNLICPLILDRIIVKAKKLKETNENPKKSEKIDENGNSIDLDGNNQDESEKIKENPTENNFQANNSDVS